MKKIITAINNNIFSEELNKSENIEVVNKDIQYKEGILEVLEKNKNIDILIINEKLPGNIYFEELIKKVKEKNENIDIIYILEKEDLKIRLLLKKYNIENIYLNNEITIKKLISIIENKEEVKKYCDKNIKDNNINKVIKIFKDIKKKKISNYFNKLKNKNKFNKKIVITINGKNGVGKTINSILISKYFENKNKKILLVDYKKNIKCILGIKNNINNDKCKYNSKIDIIEFENFIKNDLNSYKKNYDIIIIDLKNDNYYEEKNKLIKYADLNLIIMEANLLGIKLTKEIIDKLKIILNNCTNNIHILENKVNIYSIDKEIIKQCFPEINILGKIKYRNIYDEFINKNFNYKFINKKIKFNNINKEYKTIFDKII